MGARSPQRKILSFKPMTSCQPTNSHLLSIIHAQGAREILKLGGVTKNTLMQIKTNTETNKHQVSAMSIHGRQRRRVSYGQQRVRDRIWSETWDLKAVLGRVLGRPPRISRRFVFGALSILPWRPGTETRTSEFSANTKWLKEVPGFSSPSSK